jgi:hypothetical protein
MFGTKCPSITSTCSTVAPPSATAWIWSPRWAKSADNMEGASSINRIFSFGPKDYSNSSTLACQLLRLKADSKSLSSMDGRLLWFLLPDSSSEARSCLRSFPPNRICLPFHLHRCSPLATTLLPTSRHPEKVRKFGSAFGPSFAPAFGVNG